MPTSVTDGRRDHKYLTSSVDMEILGGTYQSLDIKDMTLADLLGTVDGSDVPTYGEEAERLSAARAWALTQLGPVRFSELTATGATRDITAAANEALQIIEALSRSRRSVHSTR
jgi:hypothetical protein